MLDTHNPQQQATTAKHIHNIPETFLAFAFVIQVEEEGSIPTDLRLLLLWLAIASVRMVFPAVHKWGSPKSIHLKPAHLKMVLSPKGAV